ncbi:MAG: hypothetical protein DRQ13_04185 [Ignavibacteriae bacterium]|nr:MAG: hypothetical protein DRQ13_04185 [Ignavibacteriota bacterium]
MMRKLFTILSAVLLYTTIAFGQFSDDPAAVDIPLSATDGTNVILLAVGLDLTATNGIDPALDETDLPPFPPSGVFECRFDLTPYAGEPLSSYLDYRNASAFPFTGVVEHTLWFQVSVPALPIDITYDIPTGAEMMITDQSGGSFLTIGPFTGVGLATIPGSYTAVFGKAFVIMDYDAIVTDVITSIVPEEFTLFQNYPNPFNPVTTVQFQVPQTGNVTIKIYDMLGQEVRTLFAGEVVRGTYTANWDGLNDAGIKMSSGSYIYRMIAGEFVQSKKMILLK